MIVTVFRQKTDPTFLDEYRELGKAVVDVAPTIPGFVSFKRFQADDGESCTIVEFEDLEAHNRWIADPVHRKAMSRGREAYFTEYTITVCEAIRVLRQHPDQHVTVLDTHG
ncbi:MULTISPECIES: antibiotic biosynthesis monooxygenase [unclassified Microbacterium]|uniref:antibiotic biosynthesis monooxygenase family protein n=1 Tax=unclassified Microbacterium TaxID=2609290 RepID=UPI0012F71A4E|nr:antibiotic biosynthesis monooxygenase [Microbacterium sp. MAH-37]MVQ41355.1 antibiotic biosynthesis monooxygenase [Microbacterium sp. MAH-37]